ncbi:MAG: PHP domain-containing protein [Candidatus Hydrogenedentes bacterium]|nr:PHP domain-containing protein [Candidatus Hydrogenedentota bacterium]
MPSERYADLHLHTHYSDGSDSPSRVVERAVAAGFSAIAITDHDTLDGVSEGEDAARGAGLGFVRAVEISAGYGKNEVHILGYGVRLDNPELSTTLLHLRESRETRARKTLDKLNALGMPLDFGSVAAQAGPGAAIGRMHIARELNAQGHVKSVQDAFNRFIGAGKRAYVPKTRLTCDHAIELVHGAGGLAFLAHPGIGTTHAILNRLLAHPFDGIEAYHSKHTAGQTDAYLQVAAERGLLVTGGSDCHGTAKTTAEMGKVKLPWARFERLIERLGCQA